MIVGPCNHCGNGEELEALYPWAGQAAVLLCSFCANNIDHDYALADWLRHKRCQKKGATNRQPKRI